MKKSLLIFLAIFAIIPVLFAGCGATEEPAAEPEAEVTAEAEVEAEPEPAAEPEPVAAKGTIILSTTTSTQDSGLLDYILPVFTEQTGWEVDTVAVGTGAALQMGRDGEADVLLVHAKADELTFVEEGYGTERLDVMYNDYVILGMANDALPYNNDVEQTFKTIADSSLKFVSRGDDSGTHKKELSIWKKLEVDPTTLSEYVEAGQGMGATLSMAKEMGAYTLSDRATWLTFEDKGDLEIICEKSEDLLNYYGVIPVSPTVSDKINTEGGQAFADWLVSADTQSLIGTFGVEQFGEPLFTPNAQ